MFFSKITVFAACRKKILVKIYAIRVINPFFTRLMNKTLNL